MDSYAVIMAGGHGVRFWPESRLSTPKQLLRLMGNLTFIEQTISRLQPLFPPERIVVITNSGYVPPMRKLLTALPPENIIGEPVGRDTAPCVALACAFLRSRTGGGNAGFGLFPADAVIVDGEAFRRAIGESLATSEKTDSVVTLGIVPKYPSSGYGYIELGEPVDSGTQTRFFRAVSFKEKPPVSIAEKYIAAGNYRWNAGIFVSTLHTIENGFREFAPQLSMLEKELVGMFRDDAMERFPEIYNNAAKESIDCALMEKMDRIIVGEAPFDWDDAGAWTSLRNQLTADQDNNVVRGAFAGLGTENCIIQTSNDHLVATVDVSDLVIVHTQDATLVCNARSAQRVKDLVRLIGENPAYTRYL